MNNVLSIITKPFRAVGKAISSVDWKNVKVDVWVRYILMILTAVNAILTHCGKNPIPFSEDEVYTVLTDVLTVIILIVNTYKDNPTSKESIESKDIQKAMKAAKDLEELKEVFQAKLDEINETLEANESGDIEEDYSYEE